MGFCGQYLIKEKALKFALNDIKFGEECMFVCNSYCVETMSGMRE